jgi:serine/threonine protein kinase
MIRDKAEFNRRIQKLAKLGEGSYGTVYQVRDTHLNRIVALKKIKFGRDEEGVPPTTLREIAILKEIKHENIVALTDLLWYNSKRKLYLIFEYADMDLRKYIDTQKFGLDLIKHVFFGIVKGVDHLHANGIFHRDLKPQNILIDRNGVCPKLADFGLARHFSLPFAEYSKEIVTLWYRAPEIVMGERRYGVGVDIWSLGCIFYELFMRRPLFMGDCQVDTLYRIFQTLGTPNESIWPGVGNVPDWTSQFPRFPGLGFQHLLAYHPWTAEAIDLLSKMLQLDPLKRIMCPQILEHPFFK